jgi:hypothetical protein
METNRTPIRVRYCKPSNKLHKANHEPSISQTTTDASVVTLPVPLPSAVLVSYLRPPNGAYLKLRHFSLEILPNQHPRRHLNAVHAAIDIANHLPVRDVIPVLGGVQIVDIESTTYQRPLEALSLCFAHRLVHWSPRFSILFK